MSVGMRMRMRMTVRMRMRMISHPDNPGHSALCPTELILREETGLAGGGDQGGAVLGVVADVSVVLLPVAQEGEDGVDEEEEDHGEDDDLLQTDAQL